MRLVTKHPNEGEGGTSLRPLRRSAENDSRLAEWGRTEIEDALSSRAEMDREWREALRRYEAVPKTRMRDSPVENAPNIEVALGAIAADALYAQFIDTIFNISPVVTVRPVGPGEDAQADAYALQRRVDHGVGAEWNFRPSVEAMALDTVQLGTGVLHTPFVENVRKTDLVTVTERGPRIEAWPIEDVLVPGGSRTDVQSVRWVGLRAWYTRAELELHARRGGWNIDGFRGTATTEWVRSRRETLGRTRTNKSVTVLYEVVHVYGTYDYDGDGIEEDLYFVMDRASGSIGYLRYAPYDTRPVDAARYQLRAYLFYGLGVLEMTRPGQEVVTELMNAALLNVALANIGVIAVGPNVDDQQKLWVGKLVSVPNPESDFVPKQLASPHPATAQYIATNLSLLERRVGVNDMSLPRPSAVMGSRTPGITAMSMLQQVNRRFTPAFDQMRLAAASAVRQCLYREQERIMTGDRDLEDYLRRLLGAEDGQRVINLLRDPDFDRQMSVELTASSASVNREADRQSTVLLVNILGQYYEKALSLVQIASNPQVPQPVRDVARKIADAANTMIERTIRTFDTARDPQALLVDMENELDQTPGLDPQGLMGLAGMVQSLTGAPAGEPPMGAPPMPMPPPVSTTGE